MLGGGSIQLARIFGIRIGASPSWFLVLFIMIWGLSGYFQDVLPDSSDATAYAIAVAAALLFFVALVLHELGHALVARREGIGIDGIELWFFGGIAKLSRDSQSPGEEFRVAAAGPAVTLAIIVLCLAAGGVAGREQDVLDAAFLRDEQTTPAMALLGWMALVNAFLLVFNLVPAFPLDGGRIARAVAWKLTGDRHRATRFSAGLGQGFAYLLIGVGVFWLLTADPIDGIWFAILGWFLLQAARGATASSRFSERLDGVTVADLMDTAPLTLPGDVPLLEARDEWFERHRWPWFPVVALDGRFLGVLRRESVDGAIAAGRPALAAREALDPGAAATGVRDDTPIEDILGAAGLRELGAVMVVGADGRLEGVVTAEQLRRALVAVTPGRAG